MRKLLYAFLFILLMAKVTTPGADSLMKHAKKEMAANIDCQPFVQFYDYQLCSYGYAYPCKASTPVAPQANKLTKLQLSNELNVAGTPQRFIGLLGTWWRLRN